MLAPPDISLGLWLHSLPLNKQPPASAPVAVVLSSIPLLSEDGLGRSLSVHGCRCPVTSCSLYMEQHKKGECTQEDQRPSRDLGVSKGASLFQNIKCKKEAQENTFQKVGV